MKPHWLSKLCVRAVAALQCEVCTQRTAACDCQSYDSFKNSWSSSVVTLPFPSKFNFISPCLSCRAILPSHPQTKPLTFIILALKVSHQIPYYLSVPHSLLSALLVSHVDLKLEEEKEVSDNHHAVTDKQKKRLLHLYLWKELKEKRRTMNEKAADDRNENKSKAARGEDREWQRVTQQSCEDERMLLIHDLSADSIIIWDKCPRTNQSGSDNSTQQWY